MKYFFFKSLLTFTFALLVLVSKSQTNLYVDSSVATSGNGTSWASPYKNLNQALNVANSGTGKYNINLAQGTYYPTGVNGSLATSRDSSFLIYRKGISIFGGYPAGGGTRNSKQFVSRISGDIGVKGSTADNLHHVLLLAINSNTSDSLKIDGITVEGGNANGSGTVTINSVSFFKSTGGGIFINNNSGTTIQDVYLTDCLIQNNIASGEGGGGIQNFNCTLTMQGSFIYNNTSGRGAGLNNESGGSLILINSIFSNNTSSSFGGALRISGSSTNFIRNCTFVNNSSSSGGAIRVASAGSATVNVYNCVFRGNRSGADFTSAEADISNGATLNVFNSNLQSSQTCTSCLIANTDPLLRDINNPLGNDGFFGTSDDGLILTSSSPAINVGNNTYISGYSTDITGAPRIQSSTVDMGAYEYGSLVSVVTLGSFGSLNSCGSPSVSYNTFQVSGSSLSADLVVNAPSNFEISSSPNSGYTTSLNFTPISNVVTPKTIYVRLMGSASGNNSGNITVASTGAPTQTLAVNGTINSLPTINIGSVSSVLTTATAFSLPYSATTSSPNQYSIITASPSVMSGFTIVNNATLGSSPINVAIPASAAGTYNFNISVTNSTTGCISVNNPFTVTVSPPPTATISSIVKGTPSGATTNVSTVTYNITFGASITGLTTSNFSLTTSGVSGASIGTLSGSGASYTLTVNTGTGNGSIILNLANTTGLSHSLSNTLPFIGETYTIDKTLPTVLTQNRTVYLNSAGTGTVSAAQVNNGSSDASGLASLSLSNTSFTCAQVGTPSTVTLTVTDIAGNSNTGTASITVLDTIRPIVVTQNRTVYLTAAGTGTVTASQVNNGSSDACGVASLSLSQTSFTCASVGTPVSVTLTVKDVSNNSNTGTALITVLDTVRPVVNTQNRTVYLNSAGTATVSALQLNNGSTDACGLSSLSSSQTSFNRNNLGANIVTLTARDLNNNTNTGTATITVVDPFELSSLILSTGTLSPSFINSTINYSASVLNATSSITITPTRVLGTTTMQVRVNTGTYSSVNSGSPSGSLPLNVGTNTIELLLTNTLVSPNTTKTYTITVTRASLPTITTTGTLTALNTNTGTASANTSFSISGASMGAGILVQPPTGFEVSNSATGPFTSTITVGSNGTIPNTTVFVRLAAAAGAGNYSGNIVLSSPGAANVNVPTINSTVNAVPLITSSNNFRLFNACFGKESSPQSFVVRGEFLTADVVVTAPTGFEIIQSGFSYTNSITLKSTNGNVPNTTLFIRVSNRSAITNTGGNIACTTTGGTTVNIPVVASISASPVAPSISATGALSVCAGASVPLTSTLSLPANTLAWFRNGTSINTTTTGYTASLAGTYTTVETSANGCASAPSAGAVVVVNAAPEATISQGSQLAFNNCSTTSLNLNANTGNGLTYQWRLNGADISNATSSSYAVTQAGNYTVRVANASNCSVVSTATNVLSVPSASANGSTNVCAGSTVSLTANATGFTNPTYQWLRDGAVIDNATAANFGAIQTGSYTVRITSGSLIATSCPIAVTVNPLPTVSITPSPSNSVCVGTPLTINSTAATATNYQWLNGTNPIANATAISYAVPESGTYSVRVTDANGCIYTSAASTVAVNALPTLEAISGASQVNVGSNITLFNTTSGGTWSSNNTSVATINETNGSLNGVSAGNVQVRYTVQNASGCSSFVTTNVTVNALGAKPIISTTTPTAFCAGGSVVLSSSATSLNQWYKDGLAIGGANAATYTANQSGIYTVAAGVDAIFSDGTQVTVNALPAATITQGAQLAFTDCATTSINLSANSIAGATYQWINASGNIVNETFQQYAVTQAGNYTVRVTDANGCINTSSISRVAALPTASVTGNTVVCAGTPVALSIDQSVYNAPSFQWKNAGVDVANETNANFNPSVSGTYTVSVTDNAIVSTSCPITITVNPLPTGSIAASTTAAVCAGTTVTLTATPNNASAYQWFNLGNAITNATNNNFIANTSGTYSVRITDANGCFNTIGSSNVVVNTVPVVGAISGEQTICANTNTNYTNQTTGGIWSSSNTAVATVDQFSAVRGVSAGTATITYTVTNNGCSTPVTRNITVTAAVAITTQPTTTITQCVGTNASISVVATGTNLTYQWFKDGIAIDGATTSTYTDNNLISTDAGNYTVIVSSSCGNITSSTSVWTVNAPPEATISNGFGVALGTSGSITLSANTGAGLQYRWLLGGTTIANQTASTLNVTQTGSYTVQVTSAAGCASAISSPTVVTTLPTAIAGGATTFCEGGNVNISVTVGTGQTFVRWKDANGVTVGTNSTTYNATTTGAYAAEINTGGNNVQSTQAVQVTVNTIPTPSITSSVNPAEVCAGNTVLLTGSGGVSYQWLQDNSAINNATNATFTASATGSYQLRATDANGCRATSAATTVTINPLPTASITANGNTSFCAGGSVLLTSTSTTGNQWFKDGVIINGAIDNTFTATTSGSYTVSVSSVAGCSVTSAATIVTVNAIPTATITNGSSLVLGNASSINLSANTGAGLTYAWFLNGTAINGQTNATLNIVQTGSYTVQVTNTSGCSALSTPTVVSALPTLTTGGSTSFCPGGSVLISATIGVGQTFVRWKDANGVTVGTNATTYTATTSGAYAAEINTGSSIETTQSVTVTVFALPTIMINSSVTPAAVCAGSTILLTANGGTSYQWLQDGNVLKNATGATYTANLSGAYSVRNTDANGCIATATATDVTINPRPVVAAITGTPQVCVGLATTFSNTISGGEWRTANAGIASISTTGVITGVSAGTVTISYIVTSASGCIRGVVRNITVNPLPTVAAITGTQQVCVGLTTAFVSTTIGGIWSSSNTAVATISATGIITGVSAGNATISYTVTNASGCITTVTSSSNTAIATVNTSGIVSGVSDGTATIRYTVTNASGCVTIVTRDVTVNALPTVATINGTQQVCVGLTTSFASTTTGGVWSSGNTSIATVNTSGVVSGVSAGTTTISYSVTNSNGCITTVTRDVTVNALPTVAAITGTQQVCFQSTTPFTSTTTGGVWSSGNTTAATIDAAGIITGRQAGTATISYTVTNASGCVTTVTRDITVNALPLITASANPALLFKGQSTQLNVSALGNIASFVWSPSGGTLTTNPASTSVIVNQNSTYTVTATSTQGCVASANVAVTTREDIFIEPTNVFTPNGDGINDRFVIKNLNLYPNNKLQVFDRTGKIIYEQNNYANNWDGTVNGKVLTKDTYFYVLTVNGQIVKKATITLVR